MTAALAKPTSTVTKPATTAETERSRTSDMEKAPPTIAMVRSGPTGGSGTLPGMRAYLLSRLGQTLLVVFLSLTAVFFLVRLGGDPVLLFLPMDIQAKDLNEFRQRLGFNDPLAVQYGRFIGGARCTATSASRCATRTTRSQLVLERLPATLCARAGRAPAHLLRGGAGRGPLRGAARLALRLPRHDRRGARPGGARASGSAS